MASSRLRPDEVVDLPFTSWPGQWFKEQPECWVWASNLRATEVAEVAGPDVRGVMGEFRLPNNAGDHIEIIIVPMGEECGDEVRCELVIVREPLGALDAMHLDTAISQIMQMQQIDAPDALCYLAQLYLMFRDWQRGRQGLASLLDEQPLLPLDMGSWTASQEELYAASAPHPMASVGLLLAFWFAVGGRWLGGFPNRNIAHGCRPCYNQIPMRVLSADGVAAVYGLPASAGAYAFKQSENAWTVTYGGVSKTYHNLKGLDYLATLIEKQGEEVNSTDLAPVEGQASSPSVFLEEEAVHIQERQAAPQSQIDEQARNAAETALRSIEENIEDVGSLSDRGEMEGLLEQRQKFQDYLTRGTGYQGRPRSFVDDPEKARKSVGKAIRYARAKLAVNLPELEKHLVGHLTTGSRFIYRTDPEVDWIIDRVANT